VSNANQKILVTGGAGFIGFHVVKHILEQHPDIQVVSIDNVNTYYDTQLKRDRLSELNKINSENYRFQETDITNRGVVEELFKNEQFTVVINLAAQAGVRYAKLNPESYINSNINGFYNIAEYSAKYSVGLLIYASSSSVYGANTKIPFEETDTCTSPMSLYAATKLSNENIAASYYYTHGLQTAGLRFFNVYGPWGRPDMAYFKWSKNLINSEPIELRDNGEMYRDMTYIDDVVRVIDALYSRADDINFQHSIFNVGNQSPVRVADMLQYIQQSLTPFHSEIQNVVKGSEEPVKTFANTDLLKNTIGFAPSTQFEYGMSNFLKWFKQYNNVK
jgi:UDP-glucuronate 4-epimerase